LSTIQPRRLRPGAAGPASGGDFFGLTKAGATSAACWATLLDRRWTPVQIRATATLRFVNLFIVPSSVKSCYAPSCTRYRQGGILANLR
jgi:hypothetical protein